MMELGQTTMNHGCIRFGHDGITLPSCAQGFFQMKFWFLSFSPNLLQMQYDRTTRAGRVNEPQCAHGNGYPASSRSFLASFKSFPYLSYITLPKMTFFFSPLPSMIVGKPQSQILCLWGLNRMCTKSRLFIMRKRAIVSQDRAVATQFIQGSYV